MEQFEDKPFEMRAYSKIELARLYAPFSVSDEATMRYLNRLIKYNKFLMDALRKVNYNVSRHAYLRREVELIVEHLGRP
jgi:hypothetical protein